MCVPVCVCVCVCMCVRARFLMRVRVRVRARMCAFGIIANGSTTTHTQGGVTLRQLTAEYRSRNRQMDQCKLIDALGPADGNGYAPPHNQEESPMTMNSEPDDDRAIHEYLTRN